jgi:hypothetical protein
MEASSCIRLKTKLLNYEEQLVNAMYEYYAECTRCKINLCEITHNFLILKYTLHDRIVTTVLEIDKQYAILIEINFEIQHIALALSPINLHSVYPNSIILVYSIDIKCVPKEIE